MCGLFGCAGHVQKSKKHALISSLAIMNVSRGNHSTGIGVMTDDGRHEIVKNAMVAHNFIQRKAFIEAVKIPSTAIVGHCRHATQGDVRNANAHPFRFGSIVGTHNGMVHNVNKMRAWCQREFEVDSQYLIWALSNRGHLGPAEGSLTLAYFDVKDPTYILALSRHNRPLAYGITKDGRGVVYSSELNHLITACAVAGVEMNSYYEQKNFTEVVFHQGHKQKIQTTIIPTPADRKLFA
jgi:glutamine phosphoribosylpyrophosphate amidotransferase